MEKSEAAIFFYFFTKVEEIGIIILKSRKNRSIIKSAQEEMP